ncbi:MAG: aminopeptidase P family protein [Clostridia bacterium]|nr:aminopeptidase P family protein [Clostridia bacterium]
MVKLRYVSDSTAVLVFTPVNRRYLTGFPSSLGFLLLTKNENILFVDSRYFEAAQDKAKDVRVVLLNNIYEQINDVLKKENIKKLYIETENEISLYNTLKSKLSVKVVPSEKLSNRLLDLRSVKTKQELENIIAAQRIAEKAFEDILNFIKVGVTEKQIAATLDYKMLCYGAEKTAFDTIAVSGANSSLPHGVPTDRKIEKGDFITMDFGAMFNGYCSDMTRTVCVGFATDEMKNVYNTVLSAQKASEGLVTAGAVCSEVDKGARDVIANAGYGEFFGHGTGHGIGLFIHEKPNISPKSENIKLRAGQIISNEPGIYLPKKFGVRIEDMLFVKKNGCKNLTKTPKDLIIL